MLLHLQRKEGRSLFSTVDTGDTEVEELGCGDTVPARTLLPTQA